MSLDAFPIKLGLLGNSKVNEKSKKLMHDYFTNSIIFQINKELRHKKNEKDQLPNRLSRSVLLTMQIYRTVLWCFLVCNYY
jgi:hypothetical protein